MVILKPVLTRIHQRMKAVNPFAVRQADRFGNKLTFWHRQQEPDVNPAFLADFGEQDVAAASRSADGEVSGTGAPIGQNPFQPLLHRGFFGWREPRLATGWRINHVAGEHKTFWNCGERGSSAGR